MKVLMVLDEEFPPDVRVEKEIRALQGAGHDIHLLCYSRKGLSGPEKYGDIQVFRIPISPRMYKLKALALLLPNYFRWWRKHLYKYLTDHAFDILHFHDLGLARVCREAGRKFKLKIIGDYHENRPEIMKLYHHVRSFPGNVLISQKKWDTYQREESRGLDQLILVTPEAKAYYSGHYGIAEKKITVVENFPDIKEISSIPSQEKILEKYKNQYMLVYFGDTGTRRGTIDVLEAAYALKDNPRYRFVVIGNSREQNALIKVKEDLQLNNVELTGELPLETAVSYFRAAHAGLCPFHRNIHHDTTYANKMFQYMACGLPLIVSNCTAQEHVVHESKCGVVFEAGNSSDLVDKIKTLENSSEYTKMSKNAVESVRKKYNFDLSKQKLIGLYTRLDETTRT